MRMIIGGSSQGKLDCLLKEGKFTMSDVAFGSACSKKEALEKPVLYQFHILVKRLLQQGKCPKEFCAELIRNNRTDVVISDEIGCGIVPVDAFERQWREETGRCCCLLVAASDQVDRVFCGCMSRIKGE